MFLRPGVTAQSRLREQLASAMAGFGGGLSTAAAQKQLRYQQWALPILTGTLVGLGARQGEQQRPTEILSGIAGKLTARAQN